LPKAPRFDKSETPNASMGYGMGRRCLCFQLTGGLGSVVSSPTGVWHSPGGLKLDYATMLHFFQLITVKSWTSSLLVPHSKVGRGPVPSGPHGRYTYVCAYNSNNTHNGYTGSN